MLSLEHEDTHLRFLNSLSYTVRCSWLFVSIFCAVRYLRVRVFISHGASNSYQATLNRAKGRNGYILHIHYALGTLLGD